MSPAAVNTAARLAGHRRQWACAWRHPPNSARTLPKRTAPLASLNSHPYDLGIHTPVRVDSPFRVHFSGSFRSCYLCLHAADLEADPRASVVFTNMGAEPVHRYDRGRIISSRTLKSLCCGNVAVCGSWTPEEILERLLAGEIQRREDRALQRRLQAAQFLVKTLDDFDWSSAQKDQSCPNPAPLPSRLAAPTWQRLLSGRSGPGQNPPGLGAGLSRLPSRILRALDHCH